MIISRKCKNGHIYYKSGDCPVCPVCAQEHQPKDGFLSVLGAPARRAMENCGITTLQQLSQYSEKEILSLHGMGKSSIPKLQEVLNNAGYNFKT